MALLSRLALAAGAALCAAASEGDLEDAAALVQVSSHTSAGAGLLQGRASLLARLATAWGQAPQVPGSSQGSSARTGVSCTKSPWMCAPPFDCHLGVDLAKLMTTLATDDGHSNMRSWCLAPVYADDLVKHCLWDKDQRANAQALYAATRHGKHGPFTAEADASYCFIEGHCSNAAVTFNTTLEEAERMCDFRYGHDAWAKNFGLKDVAANPKMIQLMLAGAMHPKDGFKHAEVVKPFLKAACAMGNYHCDVTYCKETYCKEEYYIKKYGHLLPRVPGHLIQQRDWLE